jgi:uncharacterized tellurite resistance protein B-like protein
MFDIIRNFLSDLDEAEEPEKVVHDQKQVAEAALMYHVIAVDGIVKEEERKRLAEVLSGQFGLDGDDTKSLATEARVAENEAIDLYQFTSILKRALTQEERNAIIENLWEMVFADGELHELEDNVVWRVAELLGVDSRERVLLKQKVWRRREEEQGS